MIFSKQFIFAIIIMVFTLPLKASDDDLSQKNSGTILQTSTEAEIKTTALRENTTSRLDDLKKCIKQLTLSDLKEIEKNGFLIIGKYKFYNEHIVFSARGNNPEDKRNERGDLYKSKDKENIQWLKRAMDKFAYNSKMSLSWHHLQHATKMTFESSRHTSLPFVTFFDVQFKTDYARKGDKSPWAFNTTLAYIDIE